MSRSVLIENVTAMLADAGFTVSDRCATRPKSFDVAARRDEDVILVKILGNIDAFDAPTGAEMRRLGTYLDATPMVIGLRTRDEELKPGVVYFRHGVPVLSPDTAMDFFVEGVPPLIYAAPGGLYVNIDGDVLADRRQNEDLSLGQLANQLGVSRRTVSKYEDGMNASIEVAMELEELFGGDLTSPVSVMDGAEEVRDAEPTPDDPEADPEDVPVLSVLARVGFEVHPTDRAPFKAVSEDASGADRVLTGHSSFTDAAVKRARIMSSLGSITHTRAVYVVDEASRDSVDDTAIVEREELEDVEDSDEFRDLLADRGAQSEA
ncbi:cro/C1 family transcription regulator [Halobacterium hubeiense]|uniref:Putative HTH-type transcriptional regulatory protein HHUB_3401 n=1 Tax=Halobacterium hubeiense TaxID=1407499 RepID=A0A0U5H9I6_9EURY|nr:transcriptional regulator [Halobacterium hubeiense]CQH61227.1 cro/C1 family transcription regulator [Halobacterium hubeiense]